MKKNEKKLLKLYTKIDQAGQETLLAFAEFLAQRNQKIDAEMYPVDIPRPENETVVAAIKRLSATYRMLNKDRLLMETSSLVTQHIMQGRAASDVIDELEGIFKQHYNQYLQSRSEDK